MTTGFILTSLLLGAGLSMDAFSVSVADGIYEPDAGRGTVLKIAGTFAAFQAAMPLIGWICVRFLISQIDLLERAVPFIALILLLCIGISMIRKGVRGDGSESEGISRGGLIAQGIATSIDALSVGFAIAAYTPLEAVICAALIGAVTLVICCAGVGFGKVIGRKVATQASVIGGVILIAIGIELFITNL